ncbi:helix-turn-helix transcriptional regulator [Mycobacterium sp. 21AC1]|uniref:AraC family transcriptional regulator n=1 Tax=[Mycobacterium] appelbergii TaxID=2939269 RepID=UPI0029391653|nr:helix-turn-helix transcriptional regulator [Mycobacterium sp. 21AC1]MDV3129121.1 helix-turn-helix transcriptional regulator [Mycobacterium sp. 21AC1]
MSKGRHSTDSTRTRVLCAGDEIDRHWHTEHQIVFPSSGVAEVRTDAGAWIAPGDCAVWIPGGWPHEHHFYGHTRFHHVGLAAAPGPDWTTPRVITATPLVRELIIACADTTDLAVQEHDRLQQVLLDQLRRAPEEPLLLPAGRDPRLRRACELVEQDLAVSWTLAELGPKVGAAERTLTRLFRDEFAMTYPQWRTRLRLHHAVRLLAEDNAVTAVAHACGWSSASAFIDVYRRALGHTPGTYRRM